MLRSIQFTRPCFVTVLSVCLLFTAVDVCGQGKDKGKSQQPTREICITFDELPVARSFGEVDRQAINYLLLDALKRHKARALGFVIGEQIETSFDILGEWLNDGHKLGSMTNSGQDHNQLGPDQFVPDIRRGHEGIEQMLSGFGQKKRYFRFPYLHYGSTVEQRRPAKTYLDENKIVTVPATVVPEDYLYNLTLSKLGKTPDSAKFELLLNDYINHVIDEIERVDRLAKVMTGKRVRHILLLRANRLNAVLLDELLMALEAEGFKFIDIDRAMQDKVFDLPEAYYGLKGLGYLDMVQQSNPDLLPAE